MLPPRLNPKHEEVRPSLANRLFTMEDALYEHGKMKEKRDESHENADKESTSTLWDLYSDK